MPPFLFWLKSNQVNLRTRRVVQIAEHEQGNTLFEIRQLAADGNSGYISGYNSLAWESAMGDAAQKRALRNYRNRLVKRGMARFEVLGLDADRELIRSLAKRLAEDDPDAARLRAAVNRTMAGEPPKKGGILAALRRSPLVGADLKLPRSHEAGRKVDL
jgi:hypothetical protein